VGALADGTEYYAPIGEPVYDGDELVVCHLCGRAMRIAGGAHLRVGHGWTLQQYREAFHLPEHVPTCSRDLTDRYREHAVERLDVVDDFGHPPAPPRGPRPARSPQWRSLAELHPELVAELSPRNEDFDPATVGAGSGQKPWWRCGECGHEWRARVSNRTVRGSGCPRCGVRRRAQLRSQVELGRSLAVARPDLAAQLDPDRNDDLDPRTLGVASARTVNEDGVVAVRHVRA
jgi:DNA-directed RNA polymerase subunit RPC12/RpoP